LRTAADGFSGMVKLDANGLIILPEAKPLTRMIARAFDAYDQTKAQHSAAI
jgi:oxygen-independent coproporphyrinogen-3 oxidase